MMLSAHPEVACRLEVFDARPVEKPPEPPTFPTYQSGDWLYRRFLHVGEQEFPDPTDEQTLRRLQQIFDLPRKACGFKFKSPTQKDVYPEIMQALLERKQEMRVVCLTRRNVLKQAISKQNMERLNSLAEDGSPAIQVANCNLVSQTELPAFELNIQQAIAYAAELQRDAAEFLATIEPFSLVHTIDYEDLVNRAEETYRELLAFLSVSPRTPPRAYFRKSTPDDLRQAITNYDHLVESVAETEFASMVR